MWFWVMTHPTPIFIDPKPTHIHFLSSLDMISDTRSYQTKIDYLVSKGMQLMMLQHSNMIAGILAFTRQ